MGVIAAAAALVAAGAVPIGAVKVTAVLGIIAAVEVLTIAAIEVAKAVDDLFGNRQKKNDIPPLIPTLPRGPSYVVELATVA